MSHPQKKCDHDTNQKKICYFCAHKTSRILNKQAIKEKVSTFDLGCNDTKNPLGICDKCRSNIRRKN